MNIRPLPWASEIPPLISPYSTWMALSMWCNKEVGNKFYQTNSLINQQMENFVI